MAGTDFNAVRRSYLGGIGLAAGGERSVTAVPRRLVTSDAGEDELSEEEVAHLKAAVAAGGDLGLRAREVLAKYSPSQERDSHGRFGSGGQGEAKDGQALKEQTARAASDAAHTGSMRAADKVNEHADAPNLARQSLLTAATLHDKASDMADRAGLPRAASDHAAAARSARGTADAIRYGGDGENAKALVGEHVAQSAGATLGVRNATSGDAPAADASRMNDRAQTAAAEGRYSAEGATAASEAHGDAASAARVAGQNDAADAHGDAAGAWAAVAHGNGYTSDALDASAKADTLSRQQGKGLDADLTKYNPDQARDSHGRFGEGSHEANQPGGSSRTMAEAAGFRHSGQSAQDHQYIKDSPAAAKDKAGGRSAHISFAQGDPILTLTERDGKGSYNVTGDARHSSLSEALAAGSAYVSGK